MYCEQYPRKRPIARLLKDCGHSTLPLNFQNEYNWARARMRSAGTACICRSASSIENSPQPKRLVRILKKSAKYGLPAGKCSETMAMTDQEYLYSMLKHHSVSGGRKHSSSRSSVPSIAFSSCRASTPPHIPHSLHGLEAVQELYCEVIRGTIQISRVPLAPVVSGNAEMSHLYRDPHWPRVKCCTMKFICEQFAAQLRPKRLSRATLSLHRLPPALANC